MNIACLHSPVASALTELGHQVLCLDDLQGVVDISALLAQNNFQPDLLIQAETLHNRVLLRNLDQVTCPTVFCAIDTHLNLHWHKYYTRLFDLVLTPHLSFYELMPPAWTPKNLGHWSMPGGELPFRPFAERGHKMVFVGLTEADGRPLRLRFLNLLAPLGLHQARSVYGTALSNLYCDTWLLPNEAIAFEVNFRLTEGASAGCCVLSPDVGEDQNRLFTPDREILVYEHGLDLVEKSAFLLKHGHLAEKLGQAARARVLSEHLPKHKAQKILEQCRGLEHQVPDILNLDLALAQRGRHISSRAPAGLLDKLLNSGQSEAMAVGFRCLTESGATLEHKKLAEIWLEQPGELDEDLLTAILGFALQIGNLDLFSLAWLRIDSAWSKFSSAQPESLYRAALFLADALRGLGRYFQLGFRFQPQNMLPETALEALQVADRLSGGDLEWARQLSSLCAKSKGLTYFRQGTLGRIVSADPDWRDLLDYGLACLQAYDLGAGTPALRQAARLAGEDGASNALENIMRQNGLEPGRYI